MKSLTSIGALVRGAMMGLALNLSLLPMVQAQQASPTRPIEPAAIVPVVPPVVIVVPSDPVTQILSVQEEVYSALFTNAWNMLSAGFVLDEEVQGPGVVPGRNELGEPFELEAVIAGVASPDMLPAEERAQVEAAGVRAAGVIGFLRSARAEIACVGIAVTIDTEEGLRREFIPVSVLRGDDALALRAEGPGVGPDPGDGPTGIDEPIGPFDGPAWTEECLECVREFVREAEFAEQEYWRERAQIAEDYNAAVAAARTALEAARLQASAALADRLASASAAMVVALAGCRVAFIFSRIAGLVCLAAAAVVYAGLVAGAYIVYRAALAAAENTYNATVGAAWQSALNRIRHASERYADRLRLLERQRDDCLSLHDCPVVEIP